MSAYETVQICGSAVQVKQPEGSGTALITDYAPYDFYLREAQERYDECRAAFFDSLAEDKDLPKKAKKWAAAARVLLGYAQTLYIISSDNEEEKQRALQIMDRISKECAIRKSNIAKHRRLRLAAGPDLSESDQDRLEQYERDADMDLLRTLNTLAHYRERHSRGAAVVSPEMEVETKVSERAARRRALIPENHLYLPARMYPPIPFPPDVPVPDLPEPYERMMQLPPEDLEYDEEHDEFVIPEGYVSEDGLLDDQSVVWDWKHHLVTMKLRGGEAVTWPFWKAKDASDVPKPDSWVMQYQIRLYDQWMYRNAPGYLKPDPKYEDYLYKE